MKKRGLRRLGLSTRVPRVGGVLRRLVSTRVASGHSEGRADLVCLLECPVAMCNRVIVILAIYGGIALIHPLPPS